MLRLQRKSDKEGLSNKNLSYSKFMPNDILKIDSVGSLFSGYLFNKFIKCSKPNSQNRNYKMISSLKILFEKVLSVDTIILKFYEIETVKKIILKNFLETPEMFCEEERLKGFVKSLIHTVTNNFDKQLSNRNEIFDLLF